MLQSLKSRVLLVLIVWLALSHLGGLWLYARKHEEAASLLQDALLAERIALVTRLVEHARPEERESLLKIIDSPLVKVIPGGLDRELPPYVEGSRPHQFEHLVGLFLDRPDHQGIKTEHQTASAHNRSSLLAMLSAKLNPEPHHLPQGTLGDILTIGTVTTAVGLSGGGTIAFTNPLLTVSPFSPLTIWAPLAAMLVSVFLSGAWVIARATRPLMHLAKAADRLGTDLRAAPLIESGALEVRTASRAFNVMQDRIQRLVEDRTAFAAALAHDIGTPITRLVLRLEDLPESELKSKMRADIVQMQRMVTATLGFARTDFQAEASERVDVMTLVQSVADDLLDAGFKAEVHGPPHLGVMTKPMALRRAVANIAENAAKYAGNAHITVRTLGAHPPQLEVLIDDNGPGIPTALHEEAFRPFRRLVERIEELPAGTGLGLSVARSFARSLGGDVTLQNRAGGGLRVSLRVPV